MNKSLHDEPLIIFDGACGTTLQEMEIPAGAWDDYEGCNEYLNISAPEVITAMHKAFFDAGAMVVETNTFGANRTVLSEYNLQDRMEEINRAAVANARAAGGDQPGHYIAGSMGPTTKLVSLGHITRDALARDYFDQASVLADAGVDCFIIETSQDLLQVKTALLAVKDAIDKAKRDIPIMVSVTIEQTGTMLVGSDIAAVCTTLEPFDLFSLGLNCATGPADMESHIRYLSHNWPKRISCIPNQGLPQVVNGKTVYDLTPQEFAEHMKSFVKQYCVSIVGGCCGTTPTHIKALSETLQGVKPGKREVA